MFFKLAEYKINSLKISNLLNTNEKLNEQIIKEPISFTVVSNDIKYIGKTSKKASEILVR